MGFLGWLVLQPAGGLVCSTRPLVPMASGMPLYSYNHLQVEAEAARKLDQAGARTRKVANRVNGWRVQGISALDMDATDGRCTWPSTCFGLVQR